jgi:serine/threonine protein kinase
MVFEFCEGGDMKDYINENGALDELTAQRFFYQMG